MRDNEAKALELPNTNGLLHRRVFLKGGAAIASIPFLAASVSAEDRSAPDLVPEWTREPGAGMSPYGDRSHHEADVQRNVVSQPGTVGSGASRTPLQSLEGMITPNSLHFERHHNGVPEIDPSRHKLLIHGMVKKPLTFDLDNLGRYPMVSKMLFIECSGNSAALLAENPVQASVGELHGLVSCANWAGIPLSSLLEEAGVESGAHWVIAEGADAALMSRSVPLEKIMDDGLLALYQNGERLRPENGYPMRLLLPGWEGNMSVKWLRRLKVVREPAMTKDETSKYSDVRPDGKSLLFTFPMGVKSVITSPSAGMALRDKGIYQITGLAWSGSGRIQRVELSADGGATWSEAALDSPVLPKAMTRFRMGWNWSGGPAVLQSRAIDETGAVQPSREAWLAERGRNAVYHYNAIQSWQILQNGDVRNVYV
jgi:sulfane dehydrogenase subunit SoxC